MKTNEELQRDVQNALNYEPTLLAAAIGVTAIEGVITLTGTVDSYRKKAEAEDAAKNVDGVKAVIEKIELKFLSFTKIDDADIAREVLNAFKWNWQIPNDKIKVRVENGCVTLEGALEWNYQKEAAKSAVSNLMGVKEVRNNVTIRTDIEAAIEKNEIKAALARNWSLDDNDIQVSVHGKRITLNGTVHSIYQKYEAGRIAWNAPGVMSVDNELAIEHN